MNSLRFFIYLLIHNQTNPHLSFFEQQSHLLDLGHLFRLAIQCVIRFRGLSAQNQVLIGKKKKASSVKKIGKI